MANKTEITKDIPGKKLTVLREFNAPVEKVWKAWTDSTLLDKWWAPKPWQAITDSMDFNEGRYWLYHMQGPGGEKHWSKVTYKSIVPQTSLNTVTNFCDKDGNVNPAIGSSYWLVEFSPSEAGTMVKTTLTFDAVTDIETLVAMGFEGGYTMGLNNLEELLEQE